MRIDKQIQEYFNFYGCKDTVHKYKDICPNSNFPEETLFIKYSSGSGGKALNPKLFSEVELSNWKFKHVFGR